VFEQADVRLMRQDDIPRVMAIHLSAFGDSFSPPSAARLKVYYECV
jgi:hypothetical protein